MMIVMKETATEGEVKAVIEKIEGAGAGNLVGSPVVGANQNGRLEVFAAGAGGRRR